MKKGVLLPLLIYVLFVVLLAVVAVLLHMTGVKLAIFVGVLAVLGAILLAVWLIYARKTGQLEAIPTGSEADAQNLEALVRSADAKLKSSRGAAKSLAEMPLVYVLGEENSAKTQTVVQSGLDPELLAGAVQRDGMVAPTQLANLWFTSSAAIVEAGGTLLKQPALWQRLVAYTAPGRIGAALSKGGAQPTRAALVCISMEKLLAGDAAQSAPEIGRTLNERLRLLSSTLGVSLPVYVLFTKLDALPPFADFVANLSDDEARLPLGSPLSFGDAAGAGLYGERATAEVAERFDELCYALGEFRLEVLSRGGQADRLGKAYEFPRELRKLRGPLVDLLVELGRPSQLGVNPFLRGFYLCGLRARLIEDAPPAPVSHAPSRGATNIFGGGQPAQPAQPRGATRRVPQWTFLPHLFPRVILADQGALDASRSSTRVSGAKRFMLGVVAAVALACLVVLTISFVNNQSLEARLRDAAAMSTDSVAHGDPASTADLQKLDQLRQVYAEISGYEHNGAPLFYRFGLYGGTPLYEAACHAYGNKLRTLLLAPAQANILAHIATLPVSPQPGDDYTATYRPLRAYLITTANPEKSTLDFLPSALTDAWTGSKTLPSSSTDLAQTQFTAYANALTDTNPCMRTLGGEAHMGQVGRARAYLSHFQGIEQVYLGMKAAADRKFKSIQFNRDFPGSAHYVVDAYEVEGAYTRGGYDFMQNAIAHPEPYTSGEQWVLGPQSGTTVDRATLDAQLPARYQTDFLNAWRTYLHTAHVVPSGGWPDAKERLHQLDSPSSALLELFQLISHNTAVPNPAFSVPFQAPQSVVPPNAPTIPTGTPYVQGLQGLEGAINNLLLTPGALNDPNGVAPVVNAASTAEGAVSTMRGGFNPPDPVGHMDSTSEQLLLAPIKSVEALAKAAPGKAAGGGGEAFCKSLEPVFNKFPFNPDSKVDVTPAEITQVFQPGSGVLPAFAASTKIVSQVGNTYMPAPGAVAQPNPAFLRFLNNATAIGAVLAPPNNAPATVSFSLTQEAVPNLPPATFDVDGKALSTAGTPQSFSWTSSPSSTVKLTAAPYNSTATGQWSLFHVIYGARHPSPSVAEFVFQMNNQTATSSSGVPLDYKFDVGGAGANLLNPNYMRSSMRCVAKVAQQ